MCGIIGYVNRETVFNSKKKYATFLRQAIHCDTLRGHHGTGVLGVNEKGKVSIYKRDLSGPDFLELSKAKDIVDSTDNVFAVAHNRWATRGTSSNENSHPFQHGDTTLFHNGTITNYHSLTKKHFSVDSDAVAYLMEEENPDYVKTLEKLEGGYSLVFFNEFEGSLNFARNEEKPMFFCRTEEGSILFGSELGMIQWLALRNGFTIKEHFSTKPGTIISIPLDPKDKIKAVPFKIKEKEIINTYPFYNNRKKQFRFSYLEDTELLVTVQKWTPYNNSPNSTDEQNGFLTCTSERHSTISFNASSISKKAGSELIDKTLRVKVTSVSSDTTAYCKMLGVVEEVSNVISIQSFITGPNKNKISRHDWLTKTKGGCSMCTTPLDINKPDETVWDDDENPFCLDCAEHYGLIEKEVDFGIGV